MKQRPHGISVCWLVIAFAFAAAVLFLLAGTASARTITVAKDGSGEHTKIQDGIDAAEDGDTVYVKEGTYNENVVVDKTINLMGVSRENTTIDAGGSGDVVKITADRVNISGFAVTGGGNSHAGIQINSDHNTIADNNCSNNKFLAIRFDTSSHNTISNNICANNRNGIILVSSDYNAVLNNICLNKYQAILLSSSNHNTVLNNTCSNNTIDLYESDYNIISNNTCNSNNDYGICITGSDHNTISNNTCSNDDFGIFFNSSDHNTISNNTCTNNNFGILLDGSDHNTISNNNCSNNAYNGISLQGCDYNLISNNTISGNGVGIRLIHNSQNNTIHRNNIYNNTQYGINATYKNIFTINATGNWWGHTSGPYHPVNNTEGRGDNVTDYVLFDPWLDRPEGYEPLIPEISITPNPALLGEAVYFAASVNGNRAVRRYVWSNDTTELYNGTNPTFTLSNLSNGTHTIYLKVQDNFGIWSEPVNTTLVVTPPDTEPPTITITSPENHTRVNGTITISGTASDNVGVLKVEYRLNGTGEWLQANGTTAWSIELNTTEFEDRKYTFEFRAYDGKQYSAPTSLTIEIKNQGKGGGGGSEKNFLLKTIGPIPLVGYLAIVGVAAVVGVVAGKKRSGKNREQDAQSGRTGQQMLNQPGSAAPSPGAFPQSAIPAPPPQPSAQSTPPPFQQPFSQSVAPPPQISPRPTAPAPQSTAQHQTLPDGSWFCPQCGNKVDGKYIFCTACGFKRSG